MGAIKEAWDGLPPIGKAVVGVALTAGAIYTGVVIIKAANSYITARKSRETVNQAASELKEAIKTNVPTFPDSVYTGAANQIQLYLTGCDFNTNDLNVLAIITSKVKNKADWLKLVTAFGVREIKGCLTQSDYSAELPTVLEKETQLLAPINQYFTKMKIPYTI